MIDASHLFLAAMMGFLLGCFFFGGLWWTVRRGMASPYPALWFAGSFFVRAAVTMGGFYFMMQGRWERLLVALAGFVVAKFIVMRVLKPKSETNGANSKEAGHAS